MPICSAIALSGYQITEQLYTGSRTLVYRAIRDADRQPVVIKLLRNEHPSFSELVQFRNQYTIAKLLAIPGIIKPYSLEPYQNGYALIMEDFGGIALSQYLKERIGQPYLPLDDFLAIALQLCDILHDFYQHRVIHKDIKPANILINTATKQVKLIDFSIASLLPRETPEIQSPNVLEGTLAYLSPEQTGRMNRGIDYRSDFYALGATFYELLTGRVPFVAADPLELIHCHIAKHPPAAHTLNPNLPPVLSAIVSKLMAKNAESRYQSTFGLKHDLHRCLEQWQQGRLEPFEAGQRDLCDRFLIPERLYGRETEVQMLLDAFERVSGSGHEANRNLTPNAQSDNAQSENAQSDNAQNDSAQSELMLIAGFSGIGKTAVVNEVHKPIVRQRGYFIQGKFDQFQRNIPLAAFVQAFRDLMGQLLSESDAQLKQWQTQILAAVGENGQVIIDVVPELEQIIGLQPPVAALSSSAAQNRFERLLQQFIQVFTTPDHPLVIFIDDLQWADAASLNLMRSLMSEANTRHLLLIGAYRDNEVTLAHPLMLSLKAMQAGATVNTMTLTPLSQASVNQLVADTLSCTLTLAAPLTALIMDKTAGNPFFTTQFLKALYADRLITFNRNENYWECDLAQVRSLTLTNNVVEFMALQLQKLPPATQEMLKLAACIGAQFDLQTLALVSEQPETETAVNLWKALQEGFVMPQSEAYKFYGSGYNRLHEADAALAQTANPAVAAVAYKFLHDRVQQAAYSLIPDDHKQVTHLKIGQLLLQDRRDQRQERIFAIVGHLNFARDLIRDRTARYELAALNLQAGKTAKASAAFDSALMFVKSGMSSLPAASWQEDYTLTLGLHDLAAEAAYLCSQFEQMEQWVAVILQKTTRLLDKVSAYETQILAYLAQSQPQRALDVALAVLQQLGIQLPKKPTQLQVLLGLAKTKLILGRKQPSQLVKLPTMTDARQLAAIQILSSAASAAYICEPQLMVLLGLERINLSVRYGNTALSAFAYAWYALILCGVLVDIETGYQFGQLALQLLEQFNATDLRAKTLFMVSTFVSHWRDRITETLPSLLAAYESGLETGDLEYAAWSALVHAYNHFWTGQNLMETEAAMRSFITAIAPLNQKNGLLYLQTYHQATLNLLGQTTDPSYLSGESYQAATAIPAQIAANDRTGLFFSHVCQQHLHYLFGQYTKAVEQSNLARPYFDNCIASLPTVIHYFYDSLARLALYAAATPPERKQILQCIQTNQKKLKKWAHHAPMNYQHKFLLVEAERYRILGQTVAAIDGYDRAIALANAYEYWNEAAIANELAAKFYLDWGKERLAQAYLIDAYYGYARWGAKAKVIDLEQRYPQLLAAVLQQDALRASETIAVTPSLASQLSTYQLSTVNSVSAALDLETILKAFQSLSSEIQLETLLTTLLTIVLENAGADACTLLLLKADQLLIEATAVLDQPSIVLQALPLDDAQIVPIALIHRVKHTLQPVISSNVAQDAGLMADPYILRQQPQSVLCTPLLYQGKLLGILYLENKLTLGAFTRDRVELLNLLCAQAAISLENARLYQQSQDALASFSTISARFQRMTDNIPGIVYQLKVAPDGSASTPYMSPGCIALLEVPPEAFITGAKDFRDMEHPDDRLAIEQAAMAATQTLTPFEHESRIITASGRVKWIQTNCRPERQADGTILWDGLKIDITDRKRAETQLNQRTAELEQTLQALQRTQTQMVQSEKMSGLGQLVAGVAHEINNPVNFIYGNLNHATGYTQDVLRLLQLYQQHYPTPHADIQAEIDAIDLEFLMKDLQKLLVSMKVGADRIQKIVASLRNFSRMDEAEMKEVNIHDGIDSTLMILQHRLKARSDFPNIKVIKAYGALPLIECYAGQLNQVFMNLLSNAIDALDESLGKGKKQQTELIPDPTITIQTALLDQQVVIQITDNGVGIPDRVKQRLFDPFFTTKPVGKGTGMGLSISYQIVTEKHQGTLECVSAPGEGATFIVTIPMRQV